MEYTEEKTCALFTDGWVSVPILTDKAQEGNQQAGLRPALKASAR